MEFRFIIVTRISAVIFLLLATITPACANGQETKPIVSTVESTMASLTVAPNSTLLAQAGTGQPFFMLADTAWNLDAADGRRNPHLS